MNIGEESVADNYSHTVHNMDLSYFDSAAACFVVALMWNHSTSELFDFYRHFEKQIVDFSDVANSDSVKNTIVVQLNGHCDHLFELPEVAGSLFVDLAVVDLAVGALALVQLNFCLFAVASSSSAVDVFEEKHSVDQTVVAEKPVEVAVLQVCPADL